ncbi:MAG: ATP-binding cassette domain-containing protein [Methanobrevibacter sp.]|uniref:ABC transporter ATP-binding protein n=1 Tax=Methanobrevibacter sp. TaxID=66852 RepID=UPI0026E019B3|nr:ATP-binding cassette domain-containing protein [Methanobrevibacter sp.]MDO5848118.1 ATP-binding cassette domain-containing protein [Methanobrevibacter sp.]
MEENYILKTENLTKEYGKNKVVDSVNIKIKKGQIYGLLGKNGAGKTTTMCMILKLANASSGNINLFGRTVKSSTDPVYKNIGSIIEMPGFYHNLTGEENLRLFSKLAGGYSEDNVKSVLEMVSLTENKNKLYKNYSLGMKQRLGIALALLKNPDLLILDEPINGLDPVGIQEIREILRSLADDYGMTILISSHILSEIEHVADMIGIMDNGKLIEEISISNLQNKIRKHVLFSVSDLSLAENLLGELGLVENRDYVVDSDDNIILFTHLDSRGSINTLFVNAGIEVTNVSLVKENLEQYFTDLIGGDANA